MITVGRPYELNFIRVSQARDRERRRAVDARHNEREHACRRMAGLAWWNRALRTYAGPALMEVLLTSAELNGTMPTWPDPVRRPDDPGYRVSDATRDIFRRIWGS